MESNVGAGSLNGAVEGTSGATSSDAMIWSGSCQIDSSFPRPLPTHRWSGSAKVRIPNVGSDTAVARTGEEDSDVHLMLTGAVDVQAGYQRATKCGPDAPQGVQVLFDRGPRTAAPFATTRRHVVSLLAMMRPSLEQPSMVGRRVDTHVS